jgi:wyosine [tRNA(Phe)-imidazoG37] synthetase (radical SAM superfamily)
MADKKFIDSAGIKRLWKNVGKKISSSVDAETQRAQAEEARIEARINAAGAECVEGEGIDIVTNENGQRVISLEKQGVTDEYIHSVSAEKITQKEGNKLVLNGGNANG